MSRLPLYFEENKIIKRFWKIEIPECIYHGFDANLPPHYVLQESPENTPFTEVSRNALPRKLQHPKNALVALVIFSPGITVGNASIKIVSLTLIRMMRTQNGRGQILASNYQKKDAPK